MTPAEPVNLEPLEALFLAVERVANRLKQNRTRRGSQAPLSPGVRGVLLALERSGPQTVPQVARVRGTSRQSIQIIVNGLEADGSVELRENPAHQRSQLINLTETGRAMLKQDVPLRQQWKAGIHGLALQDIEAATEILCRLERALDRKTRRMEGDRYDVEAPVVPLFIREPAEYQPVPASEELQPEARSPGTTVAFEPTAPEPENQLPVSLL